MLWLFPCYAVPRVQCLRDSALPVQIEAASSLRYLIELDEAEEPVLQVLPDILNEYFRIMQEIGLDEVGHWIDGSWYRPRAL